jgi:hypothetical protein
MKQTQQIAEGTHFSALSTGSFSQLNDYVLPVAPGMEIQGKVFMGQTLQTTGAEISFQSFAPGKETGFLHTHQTHEELYIFVSGKGEFQEGLSVYEKRGDSSESAPLFTFLQCVTISRAPAGVVRRPHPEL